MPSPRNSERDRHNHDSKTFGHLKLYVAIAGVLNLLLVLQIVGRFHHPLTPINHGLARILVAALAVSLSTQAAILWLGVGRSWSKWLGTLVRIDIAASLLPLVMASLRNGDNARTYHWFALVYVAFLVTKTIELFTYIGKNATLHGKVRLPAMVFAAAFVTYGGLAPWMALSSTPQGDEGHFLILSHSLAFDHDFVVGDNYEKGDYKEAYPPPPPGEMRGYPYAFMQRDNMSYFPHEPHVVRNFRGQLMLEHDMGFPLLVTPAYALDLREGALFTQALIGALGAAAVFEAATLLGADTGRALLTAALFGFTCPYWVFTQSALSDLAGAVGSLLTGLQFLRYRVRERSRYLLIAGIMIAALPWLNIRFWSLAGPSFLLLSAWIIKRSGTDWKGLISRMAWLGVPSLVSLAVAGGLDKHLFNSYMPNESMLILGKVAPQFGENPIRAFLGMLFDQSFGLLPTAPLYVAVFAGMVLLARRDRWAFAALLVPALGYLPFVSYSKFWSGGWCAPGRYLFPAVTLMIPAASLVLIRGARWIVAVLAGWSFAISILFTVNPFLRMPSVWVLYQMSMLVEFFHDHIHTPIYSILSIYPNMMLARSQDFLRGFFWLLVYCVAAWAWARYVHKCELHATSASKQ